VAQLPDCLISFSIENYKGIKHAECDGLENANWVFLTGENGSGKTTVLQVLIRGLTSYNYHRFAGVAIVINFKQNLKTHKNKIGVKFMTSVIWRIALHMDQFD